jgi:ABC-type transporter Mla MlaB component
MSKDDTPRGGLLSKVARFVLHPTVNWSDLDSRLPGTGTEEDRLALKAAIERKRRNDQVRQREFNRLRMLLKQRQLAQGQSDGALSHLPVADSRTAGARKETTIEKIAQIEAQMSQHWLRRRPGEEVPQASQTHIASAAVARDYDGGVTRPAHLQATQPMPFGATLATEPTEMVSTVPIDMLSAEPEPQDLQAGSNLAVEEAAVRFANGDDAAAEQALRAALAQDPGSASARMTWQALLDLLSAKGLRPVFEDAAGEYAVLFRTGAPAWPLARRAEPAAAEVLPTWSCPMVLDLAAVHALRTLLKGPAACKALDWSALLSADPAAAQALLELMEQLVEQAVTLRFAGGSVLRRRLKASTPSGRRENDPVWWRLRLAVLRVMGRAEEFDLAALDFCVTYGVLPPDWVPPRCRYQAAEETPPGTAVEPEPPAIAEPIKPLVTQLGGLDVLEWPTMSTDVPPLDAVQAAAGADHGDMLPTQALGTTPAAKPTLSGVLCGEIGAQLAGLQSALAAHKAGTPFAIDCSGLVRVDFPSAGTLLQWLLGAIARGVQPELHGVGRLVAAFLHVVGIDEAAPVRLREY